MEGQLVRYEEKAIMTADDVMDQVKLIQEIMSRAMKDGEHYGKIPGCGDKPTLLKPGAEKLNLTFRMSPDYEIETIDMGRGHREYRIKCKLTSSGGHFLGAGVGSASTMETKWRYRNADPEITSKPVPKEYWDLKKNDPAKANELLGGKGFVPKKTDSGWFIGRLTGEKVEHDNPADYYNTCLKMAKKRALVDAVLTVTAASDIFTQDIEEMVENEIIDIKPEPEKPDPPKTVSPEHSAAYLVGVIDHMGKWANQHEAMNSWKKHNQEWRRNLTDEDWEKVETKKAEMKKKFEEDKK